jgi:hypothetical protein
MAHDVNKEFNFLFENDLEKNVSSGKKSRKPDEQCK